MSLNKFRDPQLGVNLGLEIGCKVLNCDEMNCGQISMPPGADIDAHNVNVAGELTVDGLILIGGNDYATPDLGQPNYALHTDGAGSTFWAPDDTGSGEIVYSGVPPTIPGQLCVFDNTAGGLVKQSTILDDGATLDLNGHNMVNADVVGCNQLNTVDISITGDLNASVIGESILNMGVAVDGVLCKDGLVDGVDVAALGSTVGTNTTAIGTNAGNISTNTTDIGTNAGNISTNTTAIGTNAGNISTNTTAIGTNAGNISTNATDIGTNSTNIGNLSSNKLDKVGTANMSITNAMPVIFLNDSVSVGGCNGVICLKDSTTATIAEISAPSGYFSLKSKANVTGVISPNLRLQNDISGTPSIDTGGSLVFSQEVRPDAYFDACAIASKLTGVLVGSENATMQFSTLINGIPTDMMTLNSTGLDLTQGTVFAPSMKTDQLNEYSAAAGVTIESVLIKDGLVDGVDVSALSTTVTSLGNDKLDIFGSSNLTIINNSPGVTLKDDNSTGSSDGRLRFTDSANLTISTLSASSGYLDILTKRFPNNIISPGLRISNLITGTPAVGCGGELILNQEVSPGLYLDACSVASLIYDVTSLAEKSHMIFKTMTNRLNTEKMRLSDNLTLYSGIMQAPAHACTTLDKYDTAGALLIGSQGLSTSVELSKPAANTTVRGNLVVDQDFTYTREFFNVWTSNGTSTTPVLVGQLTKILFGVGEVQIGFLNGFSFGGANLITYTGSRTKKIHLSCTMTISVSEKDRNLQIYLRKNGTTLIPSIIAEQRIIDKDWHFSVSFAGVETFSTGNYVELFCIYGKNANVFIHNMNFTGQALPNP
jgi:hypothetical protein